MSDDLRERLILAYGHEDYCCAKGCWNGSHGIGGLPGACDGACNCMVGSVVTALLPLIEAERQKASDETAKAIRDELRGHATYRVGGYASLVLNNAADLAAAHIKDQ